MKKYPKPKKGDIWKENDNRFDRYVAIINVGEFGCNLYCGDTDRHSWSRIERFNGKSGGYSLFKRGNK
jgi:hypothetical protein